jgi:phosphate starvation-inducible PhoH-like protein
MENNKNDRSLHVPQRDKFKGQLQVKDLRWTEKQKTFIDLVLEKQSKMIFVDGVAGTGKTLMAVYCGLKMLNEKKISDIVYVRSVIESASKSLGFLPGESDDKFKPFILPLEDKLEELLNKTDKDKLMKDDRIMARPINYLRGANFNAKFIICDEAQNFDFKELTTLVTRIGQFSKIIICGDSHQSDINGKSGFKQMYSIFNDEESRNNGIFYYNFGIEDVMRSELVKFILTKLNHT